MAISLSPQLSLFDGFWVEGAIAQREIPNLASQKVVRGMSMGLTSSQDVYRTMCREVLIGNQLRVGKATNQGEFDNLPMLRSINYKFEGKLPLCYYILAEA